MRKIVSLFIVALSFCLMLPLAGCNDGQTGDKEPETPIVAPMDEEDFFAEKQPWI